MIRIVSLFLLVCASHLCVASEPVLHVGQFSKTGLDDWEEKEFEGTTEYQLVTVDGEQVLQAVSEASASGLFREITIDIKKYPYLNWRWKVEKALPELEETTKDSDDYAVRIYVVKSGGLFFWKTKALNYVWSSRSHKEAQWPNAYAPDNAKMIAVRSAMDDTTIWHQEKRNVYLDLKAWLGDEVDEIDGVAIMTDTDNSKLSASALYGDIFFSRD